MNKFKLNHPLIMACFYLSLLLFIGYIHFVLNHKHLAIITIYGFNIHVFMTIIILGIIFYTTFLIVYTYYYRKWDKGSPFSLKPPEINDQDEGTQQMYAAATRRVYIFYTTVIPLLAVVALFMHLTSIPIEAYMLVYLFLLLLSIHYFIFYKVVRDFIK